MLGTNQFFGEGCLAGQAQRIATVAMMTDSVIVREEKAAIVRQDKIERWHQTLNNRILLENYYLPGDLEAKIDAFVDHYNHRRPEQSHPG